MWALQARGIDGDAPPHYRVQDMAADYVEEVQALQPHGPYTICGFSFGGTVAYEMARLLAASGREVDLVVLLDAYVDARLRWPVLSALRVAHVCRKAVQTPPRQLPRATASSLADGVQDLRFWWTAGHRPSPSEKLGLMPVQRKVYDALSLAVREYRPGEYQGPVLLIRTQAPLDRYFNSLAQWKRVAGRLEVVQVPGEHLDLVGRYATLVASHLDRALLRPQEAPGATIAGQRAGLSLSSYRSPT